MPTQQRLKSIYFQELKNLKDVEICFEESPVTALMGSNGCGKTTVLHALACIYAPLQAGDPNYKLSFYLKPTTDGSWQGSSFRICYSERDGIAVRDNVLQEYSKATDRWSPKYERRPQRYTRFISIRESVPEIETNPSAGLVTYVRQTRTTPNDTAIKDAAGQILNRNYTEYHDVTYSRGSRSSIGVTNNMLTYSALSMSAGEQRVFKILEGVLSVPNYSLILIDEIDLFLHQDALTKLMNYLVEHCTDRNKQLVVTTHFPPIASMYDRVSVKTLHRTPQKTQIWSGYSSAALRRITGINTRDVFVYVEDDVAYAIAAKVAAELNMRPHVEIILYGPAINAFKVGAGLILANEPLERTLIVLDGDLYTSRTERIQRINSELTGTEAHRPAQRRQLKKMIISLRARDRRKPEQSINEMIQSLDRNALSAEDRSLFDIASGIIQMPNTHGLINDVIDQTGEQRAVVLNQLMTLASQADDWEGYTRSVRLALQRIRNDLNIDPNP